MMDLLRALMMAPVTGAMGAASAIANAVGGSMAPTQPQLLPPRQPPLPVTPASAPSSLAQPEIRPRPAPPGEWSDLPLPPVLPVAAPAPVTPSAVTSLPVPPEAAPQPSPPPRLETPPPRHEIEFSKSIERKWNMDRDLNDDMNKLVRYSIVCVDRENETVLQGLQETLVRDRLDESGFTAWKILEFVQKMAAGKVDVPWDWEHGNKPDGVVIEGGKLHKIGGDPMKYLRVPFQVVDRYPREHFKYEEKQIHVLRRIEEVLERDHPKHSPPPPPPPPGGTHGGGGTHYGGGSSSAPVPSASSGGTVTIPVTVPPAGQEAVFEIKPK